MENYRYDPLKNVFIKSNKKYETSLPQLMWHVTDKCNLYCPFCFSTKSNNEFSKDHLIEYIDIMKKLKVQKIDISGGEPLLYDNLEELCNALRNSGIYITLTSSGIAPQEKKDWLLKHNNMFARVIFSVDAPHAALHDKIRGKVGTFIELFELIRNLQHEGCMHIRINTVVTRALLNRDICDQMIETINNIRPIEWCLIQPHPANKKQSFSEHDITDGEFNGVVELIMNSKNMHNQIKILTRNIENFAGYWVLYPDGELRKHTNEPIDSYNIKFEKRNIDLITNAINTTNIWLPHQIINK